MTMTGNVAIVTGSGSGIGRATLLRLVTEGVRVVGMDLNAEGNAETAAIAEATGRDAALLHFVTMDVTADEAPATAVSAALDRFGQLNWLINNAGRGRCDELLNTSDSEWDGYLDINLRSAFRFSREALPHLATGNGCIIHVSSVFGLMGQPGYAPYAAAKAALVGLTYQMAADYGPRGIRVNAVAPGLIITPAQTDRMETPHFQSCFVDGVPFNRLGRPEDVASSIRFLCSEDASFISGHVLVIDGGWAVTNYSRSGSQFERK